jgi:Domain of unknown function (DUF4159)
MTKFARRTVLLSLLLCSLAGALFAQRSYRQRRSFDVNNPRSSQVSVPTPEWTNDPGFEKDVFTFVRIIYSTAGRSRRGYGYGWGGSGRWATDWPDADLNLAWRLQQMTSLRVDPNGRCIEITDPSLFRYPFIYIVEPGDLTFTDEEAAILRKYLLNGGFLMIDDFWGEDEWDGMAEAMRQVFPDREFQDIPRTHPIFHCVFPIPNDLNLQCPAINWGVSSEYTGVTWERSDAQEVHIRGIYDDKGRLCVIACHNTDNGDGWEREGESAYYFREFSEKKAYPLGINIIFYAMTH